MSSQGSILTQLSQKAKRYRDPRSAEEAEAILIQMAGSIRDADSVDTHEPGHDVQVNETAERPSAAEIQQSISAVQNQRQILESVADAVVIVDRRGIVALANSQSAQLFGYLPVQLLGQQFESLFPERSSGPQGNRWRSLFDQPDLVQIDSCFEVSGRHQNSHEFPMEIRLRPLQIDGESMTVATIRDMSEPHRIAAESRRFEARYRTLVEGLPAVTFMAALDGGANELYVSPQIETLLGFSQEEWLGNPILWYTQLHPDDRNRWHLEFSVTCATGHKFNSIYRFFSRAGRVVWVHGEAKVIRDELGRPLFLQGVAFDISQLKEAEDQLRQLNQTLEARVEERTSELSAANESLQLQMRERLRAEANIRRINVDLAKAHEEAIAANQIKSQFLANMSHELRTPLNAIIGYSELLQLLAARKHDDTYSADLERIKKAGFHLLVLINDILDISKIEAGKMHLELEVIAVQSLIEDIQETAFPLAAANKNTLEFEIAEPLGFVKADITRLKQCLLNLVSNACKFTRAGRVTFSVAQETIADREWLMFRIRDTGIGLTDEQAARLFQPFTQADASTTRKFGGTGLGLAITKKLCEAMGGSISLKSTHGEGSTFTIQLPVVEPT